ncbi:hypothetical protein IDG68_14805, partial [Staphylococcus sp. EG-SA-21]|uniref:hypothetical protein n=1 Tax=Staphylococcus sp. EG-SA-21 TaxID=2767496 RepID=UPI00198265E4
DVFPWRQHDVKLVFFLAISHKDKAFTKQMMQLIANLDDDSVNRILLLLHNVSDFVTIIFRK